MLIQAVSATDLMFRTTDVIFIISGVVAFMGSYFAFRASVSKINDRIDSEVKSGDDKRAAIRREFEIHVEKHKALESRINEVENSLGNVEGEIRKQMDTMSKEIQGINLLIEKKMNEILQQLLPKRR